MDTLDVLERMNENYIAKENNQPTKPVELQIKIAYLYPLVTSYKELFIVNKESYLIGSDIAKIPELNSIIEPLEIKTIKKQPNNC